LAELGFGEIGKLADAFSVNEFLQRELIKKRLEKGNRISLREFLYPLMQGYDSVALEADVEIGGTDQKFNVLAGRTLQKLYHQEPQNIILLGPLLEGTDGRKMSSSWGNTINLLDEADEMFGKVMSARDELIETYFIHATRLPLEEVEEILKEEPREAKLRLAFEITKIYHGEEKAQGAQKN
jgi:tyrosyl-tRNA synthetase